VITIAHSAMARTLGKRANEYRPAVET